METQTLKAILGRADNPAQQVIDEWNRNITGDFSPEFKTPLHKASLCIIAMEKHRAFDILTERDKRELEGARTELFFRYRILRGHASWGFLLD